MQAGLSHLLNRTTFTPFTLPRRKFENRAVFSVAEKHQIFPSILSFRFKENSGRKKAHDYPDVIVFEKLRFHVFRPAHIYKRKASVFKFLRLEERFRKAPFW